MGELTFEETIVHAKEIAEKNYRGADFESIDSVDDDIKINCIKYAEEHEQLVEWLEELKFYKEAEEQGLLVRLPCKIGDMLYCIDNGIVELLIVNSFSICNFNRIEIDFENASGFTLCTFSGELDEGYFLTREEAEKKLEEMKNDGSKK